MSASPNNPLFMDKNLLEMYLKSNDYFTLYQSLFPNQPQSNTSKSISKRNDPTSRDITTYKNDISIMQLLETSSPFKLQKVFQSPEIVNYNSPDIDQLTSWYLRNQQRDKKYGNIFYANI